jgi:hypothetical protein
MACQWESRISRLGGVTFYRRRATKRGPARARLQLGLALVAFVTSTVIAPAQSNSPGMVPVTLLSDHILREGDDIFMATAYPMDIVDDHGKRMIAPAGSYLRCKAGARGKNSLPLSDCHMLIQPIGAKENYTYTCTVIGSELSVRWRNRLFWDQLVNAGETWQGAVGSFAIGSTAALFTTSHAITAVGTGIGFALTSVGPLAKHHPAWFQHSKMSALPDNRTLLFNPGRSTLSVGSLQCVGDNCPQTAGQASGNPFPAYGKTGQATGGH